MCASPTPLRLAMVGCGFIAERDAEAVAALAAQVQLVAAGDVDAAKAAAFAARHGIATSATDLDAARAGTVVDAVCLCLPHHLHAEIYRDIIAAGKHLLGEKPFGIDRPANAAINEALTEHPDVLVRCSSEIPFFPGAMQITKWVGEGRFGRIIDVNAGFWHSSDLDPDKPINWKRMIEFNGEYGCMGDLGMHALHLPLRYGWRPTHVRALLSNVMATRPDGKGPSTS